MYFFCCLVINFSLLTVVYKYDEHIHWIATGSANHRKSLKHDFILAEDTRSDNYIILENDGLK